MFAQRLSLFRSFAPPRLPSQITQPVFRSQPLRAVQNLLRSPTWNTRFVATTTGILTGISSLYYIKNIKKSSTIYNDVKLTTDQGTSIPVQSLVKTPEEIRRKQYKQLCLGSIFGIVAGVIVSKLSSILIAMGLLSLVSVRWLMRGNVLVINRQVLSKEGLMKLFNIDSKTLNSANNVYFKGSFLTCFLLAAFNV
ncbi:Fun14p NDAI_0H02630 [Naumovozyma dairenensis CBS 421]|uniref:FUN14 domain-containing protein n=1 Tax=Naumovozyma dairenensis (strain ATCC 10597 / BCRC 20456 / CBS 421 / NBRC 0211 / NRRL Y-12639) TaxID=1071378 RepID=G0WF76_NAUDC|nr:hypothetical protein NDAI_0H02630 [Naumovozyma dairenensis CBS 421]CCD26437.1 hypothetical protein NDAI_0H02630 [Naumovozyma dairenensis CBS 421]